jgi:hypothetical protein
VPSRTLEGSPPCEPLGYAGREWRNGRRAGLRIRCPKGRGSSTLPSRTPSDLRILCSGTLRGSSRKRRLAHACSRKRGWALEIRSVYVPISPILSQRVTDVGGRSDRRETATVSRRSANPVLMASPRSRISAATRSAASRWSPGRVRDPSGLSSECLRRWLLLKPAHGGAADAPAQRYRQTRRNSPLQNTTSSAPLAMEPSRLANWKNPRPGIGSSRSLRTTTALSKGCPTSNGPSGSANSGATRRAAHSPSVLVDCEEDRTLRAVLVGMLREDERR